MINENIRQATINDLHDIVRIWIEGVEDAFGGQQMEESITAEYISLLFEKQILSQNDNHKIWLYINSENKPVGYCSVLPMHPSPMQFQKWAILSLYVDKEHQNHKLGYWLLKFALDFSKHNNQICLFYYS